MDPNVPIAYTVTEQDIRLLILEAWENGDVAESIPGSDPGLWTKAAKDLSESLEISLETPVIEDGVTYIRANHGFPIEMHWQSPEARQWLHSSPGRIDERNLWNDMFLGRGGLA